MTWHRPGAPSLLQSRAQLPGSAGGLAAPPLGPLGPPRCPGQRGELPCHALLPGLGQHVAAPFISELAESIWIRVRVTHLLSVPLSDGRVLARYIGLSASRGWL